MCTQFRTCTSKHTLSKEAPVQGRKASHRGKSAGDAPQSITKSSLARGKAQRGSPGANGNIFPSDTIMLQDVAVAR
jgi:hypothetical protein